jgi:ComF family protein
MTILQTLLHACGLDEERCGACHAPYSPRDSAFLCPDCRAAVLCAHALCIRCGAPLPRSSLGDVCARCLANPPPWSNICAVGQYEGLLRDLLLRAKYRGDRSACRLLGRLLAEKLDARGMDGFRPELILPMPLHPMRLRRRGFNQCQEIAEPVSRLLGMPRCPHLARRIAATPPQTGLRRNERLRNLERAFSVDPAVRGRRLLILDDTITTGTTLRRLARCLLQAGAAEVSAAAVAVVLPHNAALRPAASPSSASGLETPPFFS